ncbi:putative formamidase C869.04 [Selaginella moellendorffii]|uniref:putative formamidase C869.04 n=1 Tax=Selaginella moellendorffii TaxID=88036 RepID=UPI000D1C7999|nr:putative formamidase C869.04 [Selaginella moellendorffii]XP_024535805.1 putative formamidase C869.04 [Selaginella moellendorffii]|eukprot:XP_024535804.1 putative formamidase C869.04 [Selaginella moellendorffii]
MAPRTPRRVCDVDFSRKAHEQQPPLHNRWHPDIPHIAEVQENEIFTVEMMDCAGGAIRNDDSVADIEALDLSGGHYLSGPVRVVDESGAPAMPGDILMVEICDLGPISGQEWGFTAILPGFGFLSDRFPNATKAIWDFEGIFASSRHIPGVRFPGMVHPGLIGTAPSKELLEAWNAREKALVDTSSSPLVAALPTKRNVLLGTIEEGSPDWERIASEAARTVPGRENGGNLDIKNLSRGCKVYFPVFVEGANLSMGDMHFSQGDGEIAFCGGIEMNGFLTLRCEILRGGMKDYMSPTNLHAQPFFEIGPIEPRFSDWLVFEGISVDEHGRQHYLDTTLSFKRAVLNAIEYLSKFGYTREQIYLLLSCCPCESRISSIVDFPNAVATIAIPTAIFDQDIKPKKKR